MADFCKLTTLTRKSVNELPFIFHKYIMCEIRQGGDRISAKVFTKLHLNHMRLYIIFDPIEERERLESLLACMAAAEKRLHRDTMHSNRF